MIRDHGFGRLDVGAKYRRGEVGDDVFPNHLPGRVDVWIGVHQRVKRLILPQLLVTRAISQNPLKSSQVGIRPGIGGAHDGFGYWQPAGLVRVWENNPQAGSREPSLDITASEQREQELVLDYRRVSFDLPPSNGSEILNHHEAIWPAFESPDPVHAIRPGSAASLRGVARSPYNLVD